MPYDRDTTTVSEVEGALLASMHQAQIDPWCGLCGSRDLFFDHGKLPFTDWDTALAALRACEADQLATRDYLNSVRSDN